MVRPAEDLPRPGEAGRTDHRYFSPDAIDRAEDRERFQQMVQRLGLRQPANATARSEDEALAASKVIGYPLVVRPSYVLGGRAMEIVYQEDEPRYMREAVKVSNDSPVLLDHFLTARSKSIWMPSATVNDVVIGAIMQHIEQAGVTPATRRARCRLTRCRCHPG